MLPIVIKGVCFVPKLVKRLSVVIPVHNEEGNVKTLHAELLRVVRPICTSFEIIFVDDASTDGTLAVLKTLKPVTVLHLGRNTGQSAALKAGFDYATGEIVVSLDGDGQNDPTSIPAMIQQLFDEQLDCVSGWRKDRKDSLFKKLTSRVGVGLHHLVIDDKVHDSGCTLKVYKNWCVKDLELYGEMHRYLPALLILRGAKIGERVVRHRARTAGKTKYSSGKIFKGFMDLFLVWFWQKYSARPVHLMGFLAFLMGLFGIVTGSYAWYLKFFRNVDLSNTFLPNIAVFSALLAVQLLALGVLMDMMVRNYHKNDAPYRLREVYKR